MTTTLQSSTPGHHFDGVELRSGTYQVSGVSQTLSGGFAVNVSPFDPSRTSSNLITDFNLALTGVGSAKAFKIGAGQTLVKVGTGTLNINGDQLHSPGATLQANQGVVNLNTDAGMNAGGPTVNNLTVGVGAGATVNFAVTQHLAQIAVNGGVATLTAGATSGSKLIETTGVSVSSGKLDLTNNRLIVDYSSGGSPISSIRQQIIAGYNAGGASGVAAASSARRRRRIRIAWPWDMAKRAICSARRAAFSEPSRSIRPRCWRLHENGRCQSGWRRRFSGSGRGSRRIMAWPLDRCSGRRGILITTGTSISRTW